MINEVFVKALVVPGQATSGGLEQIEYHVVKLVDAFICLGKTSCRGVSVSAKSARVFWVSCSAFHKAWAGCGRLRKSRKIISKLLVLLFSALQILGQ